MTPATEPGWREAMARETEALHATDQAAIEATEAAQRARDALTAREHAQRAADQEDEHARERQQEHEPVDVQTEPEPEPDPS